ncbi:MAG: glycosyltransferase family 2 protein [Ruminococcus sp.]|nr:glycosyltransferase family 2 protein [Ruminococcus sp.]
MRIATILFTYNRPFHTQKVLEALSHNDMKPQKLIIFQDGMKHSTDQKDWEAVGEIIKSVRWCETEIHISERNKGLADSIVEGIDYAFQTYDAVIVLEDDCVPHPKYMYFMNACLNRYWNEEKVYSIGGCPEPIDIDREPGADMYFCGRFSSHGWGTWKDRWDKYERDYAILKRIKNDKGCRERLHVWGSDLESHLLGNISGECDSWAVFWALKLIEKDGYFLCPYESLIKNIGWDGSGVHCDSRRVDREYRVMDNMEDFSFPDEIRISRSAQTGYMDMLNIASREARDKSYRELLCRWIEEKQQNRIIKYEFDNKKIAFWGKGWLLDLMQKEFGKKMQVQCVIETYPNCEIYKGIPVYSVNEIPEEIDTIIVIPFCDIEIIRRKIIRRRSDIKSIVGVNELIG